MDARSSEELPVEKARVEPEGEVSGHRGSEAAGFKGEHEATQLVGLASAGAFWCNSNEISLKN